MVNKKGHKVFKSKKDKDIWRATLKEQARADREHHK